MHPPKPTCRFGVYLIVTLLTMVSFRASTEDESSRPTTSPTENLIYIVLAAELAAKRDQPDIALEYYLKAASMSQDPAIAEQATQWAVTFQAPEPAMVAAQIWAKNAPNDLQPQLVVMTLFIGQSVDKAKPYLKQAILIAPQDLDQQLAAIQGRLSKKSAGNLKIALESIAKELPKNPHAALVAGQSAALEGDISNANQWIDKALSLKPDLTAAVTLKSRLLRFTDKNDTRALKFLDEKLKTFPNNAELRLFYASALLDANRLNDAVIHLKKLTQNKVYGGQALLFLGEIYVSAQKYSEAKNYLKLASALENTDERKTAEYLLGSIAEIEGNTKDALGWYLDISPGTLHVQAVLRASRLLIDERDFSRALYVLRDATPRTVEEQKQLLLAEVELLITSHQLKEADDLTSELMEKAPQDPDIIYAHAQVATKLKRFEIAEKDLKSLLEKDPRNPDVLNALAYLLAFQKDRLEEAKNYATQALQLSPNHPFYLDTAGWIAYQLGNKAESLIFLKKAASLSPDPEIAAHLGEVLWSTGSKDEALKLWEIALKKDPNNDILLDTLTRLKTNLSLPGAAPLASTQP